jgi:hypothetical protein
VDITSKGRRNGNMMSSSYNEMRKAETALNAAVLSAGETLHLAMEAAREAYDAIAEPAREAYETVMGPAREAYYIALDAYEAERYPPIKREGGTENGT